MTVYLLITLLCAGPGATECRTMLPANPVYFETQEGCERAAFEAAHQGAFEVCQRGFSI